MIVAIMQPYFFPYIGYWQLIRAADHFVLLDEVQYMRHGWINRNRILKPGGGWQYIVVPLAKHGPTALINAVESKENSDWRALLVRQLAHYRKKARHYEETISLVQNALNGVQHGIAGINSRIVNQLCQALGIETKITLSSAHDFNYGDVESSGDWALSICRQLGASRYINPIGGAHLFDRNRFASKGISLGFLEATAPEYSQGQPFEPSLSIIDVLMFNGLEKTRTLVDDYVVRESPP